MPTDEFELIYNPVIEPDADFEILDKGQADNYFELVPPEIFDILPASYSKKSNSVDSTRHRPICFIDGEGSNIGEKTVTFRKHNLRRWVQKQNYSLLGATLQNDEYRCLVGENNQEQISTKKCLQFILDIPSEYLVVGYALTYDVEHWLRSIPNWRMERLLRDKWIRWRKYRIHYIPHKIFTVSEFDYETRTILRSRTVYDIFGFFQCSFKDAIYSWDVGTKDERDFIERMKLSRPDFGPITEEVKAYNKQEGLHGIQLFSRVREEYSKLELRLPKPVGAGSIASAMFRKHNVRDYFPTSQILPTDTMLSAYYGGRFDVTRVGFVGNVYESDINSAYPHIARNLPCLRCGYYKVATTYDASDHSLWLVRWSNNGTRWSPFPYRTDNGHIRYYVDGIGYYYTAEVESALSLSGDIEIISGYRFVRNCDHRPFAFLEDYYQRRQEMLREGDFGEQIIKYGSNSVYGKLAQSKGKTPRYQNLIWAGMITSGTRAMLLRGIAQNPDAVLKVATDALFSTVPLQLEYGGELGQWKMETLYDLLILGNGIYQSTGSSNQKHPDGVAKSRGFARDGNLKFDWNQIRENYRNGITSIVQKHEFRRFVKAFHENRLEERCDWIDIELEFKLDIQKQKRTDGEYIYPLPNPTPNVISAPINIPPANLNLPNSPEGN